MVALPHRLSATARSPSDRDRPCGLDDSFADPFQVELLAVGAALVQRIEREESLLFPLYRAVH